MFKCCFSLTHGESPESSSVSMKSDRSMDEPVNFSSGSCDGSDVRWEQSWQCLYILIRLHINVQHKTTHLTFMHTQHSNKCKQMLK